MEITLLCLTALTENQSKVAENYMREHELKYKVVYNDLTMFDGTYNTLVYGEGLYTIWYEGIREIHQPEITKIIGGFELI